VDFTSGLAKLPRSPSGQLRQAGGFAHYFEQNVIWVTSILVVEAYIEIAAMRHFPKLVGLILAITMGLAPSIALAGTCIATQKSHPCCPPESVLQFSMAIGGLEAPAPCCRFSSEKTAPTTASQIQRPSSGAHRLSVTRTPLVTCPLKSGVRTEPIQEAVLPPALSSLCTLLI
jgi:hypothetical protein